MAGTFFHGRHIALVKWFWAIYFLGSDKGSISALRLSKLIEVNWRTARLILKKLRVSMGRRDSLYQLSVDEFSYRFNRRFVEKQIPNRLLNLAIIHAPVKST